ncbi:MAG: hypothetical protein Q8K49_06245 [Brevundimonas sp.]|nr:hypothetical protein [Brevundimonas sp.]
MAGHRQGAGLQLRHASRRAFGANQPPQRQGADQTTEYQDQRARRRADRPHQHESLTSPDVTGRGGPLFRLGHGLNPGLKIERPALDGARVERLRRKLEAHRPLGLFQRLDPSVLGGIGTGHAGKRVNPRLEKPGFRPQRGFERLIPAMAERTHDVRLIHRRLVGVPDGLVDLDSMPVVPHALLDNPEPIGPRRDSTEAQDHKSGRSQAQDERARPEGGRPE